MIICLPKPWIGFSLALAACALVLETASADVVTLSPLRDNTLYQSTDPDNQSSNGRGDIFAGRTGQDGQGPATVSIRRGLVLFDVAAGVPAGATVTDVVLTMTDIQGLNGDQSISLHRALADWGEGDSYFNGGQGAAAADNDATWLYRFFNTANPTASPAWDTPGGDFETIPSATTVVTDLDGPEFNWHDAAMLADVQSWLDVPMTNFGWVILGDETAGGTAKRFASGETVTPPQLQVTYTIALPGDGNGDGLVDGLDYLIWAGNFGTHPGSNGNVSDGDYNGDGWVDGLDYLVWAASFGSHSATNTPEPTGISLIIAGGLIAMLRHRRLPRGHRPRLHVPATDADRSLPSVSINTFSDAGLPLNSRDCPFPYRSFSSPLSCFVKYRCLYDQPNVYLAGSPVRHFLADCHFVASGIAYGRCRYRYAKSFARQFAV